MKVAVLTLFASRSAGGLFESVRFSSRALCDMGVDVDVLALRDRHDAEDLPQWLPMKPQIFGLRWARLLGLAPGMERRLGEMSPDLVHVHGLWEPPSIAAWKHKRKHGTPYIVSPRGMLDPWAVANSAWKKRIAAVLFENRHLRGADCLHALCDAEAEAMRAYGLQNPIAVVPNGVVLPRAKPRSVQCSVSSVQPEDRAMKTLLFLGRLHPKKGLPEALRAWAEVTKGKDTAWRFVIAGWDQGGHEAELKRLCGELGVRFAETPADELTEGCQLNTVNSVVFAGPAFGEAKDALLRSADAFILPSLSEGLPMSVLEAWAYGLPVLMTDECNLPEGFATRSAIRIGPVGPSEEWRVKSGEWGSGGRRPPLQNMGAGVSGGMRALMEMTDAERAAMGARGRALVEERFTWPKVAAQMKEVYEWVLGRAARPDFVRAAQ